MAKDLASFDLARLPAKVHARYGRSSKARSWIVARTFCCSARPAPARRICFRQSRRTGSCRAALVSWPCALLVQELLKAKRDLKLRQVLKQMSKCEALLIDDIGYVQQSREEMEVLFTLLADRYERGTVMLTSNLPFSKWETIFKDPMTTAAAIDRLVHHSVILELNIASYRLAVPTKPGPILAATMVQSLAAANTSGSGLHRGHRRG